jgi:hypothetical protein
MREGESREFGFILLNGNVTLTKIIKSNLTTRKKLIAEVSGMDIIGSDCVYNNNQSHFYTYTVNSSTAECIRVSTS